MIGSRVVCASPTTLQRLYDVQLSIIVIQTMGVGEYKIRCLIYFFLILYRTIVRGNFLSFWFQSIHMEIVHIVYESRWYYSYLQYTNCGNILRGMYNQRRQSVKIFLSPLSVGVFSNKNSICSLGNNFLFLFTADTLVSELGLIVRQSGARHLWVQKTN